MLPFSGLKSFSHLSTANFYCRSFIEYSSFLDSLGFWPSLHHIHCSLCWAPTNGPITAILHVGMCSVLLLSRAPSVRISHSEATVTKQKALDRSVPNVQLCIFYSSVSFTALYFVPLCRRSELTGRQLISSLTLPSLHLGFLIPSPFSLLLPAISSCFPPSTLFPRKDCTFPSPTRLSPSAPSPSPPSPPPPDLFPHFLTTPANWPAHSYVTL